MLPRDLSPEKQIQLPNKCQTKKHRAEAPPTKLRGSDKKATLHETFRSQASLLKSKISLRTRKGGLALEGRPTQLQSKTAPGGRTWASAGPAVHCRKGTRRHKHKRTGETGKTRTKRDLRRASRFLCPSAPSFFSFSSRKAKVRRQLSACFFFF